MDSRYLVLKQTAAIGLGELVCSGIMLGIYAALDKFTVLVLWSAVAGCIVVTLNFLFMSITVSMATQRAKDSDAQQAKKMIQTSSVVRLFCMGAVMVLGIKLGAEAVALVLPLAFLRPVLMITEFFGKKVD